MVFNLPQGLWLLEHVIKNKPFLIFVKNGLFLFL